MTERASRRSLTRSSWSKAIASRPSDRGDGCGSIEPGKLADFTIVEGNPRADIGATKNIRMVIKGGEVVDTGYDSKWVNPVPRRPASIAR